jgi:hypothetical protein
MGMPASPPVIVPRLRPELRPATDLRPAEPVVVHIRCAPRYAPSIRIWPSTFLLDRDSAHTSALVDWKGITAYPDWTWIRWGAPHPFALIFEPLPRSVRVFDLQEIIPEPRGWHFPGIARKAQDVYHLDLP